MLFPDPGGPMTTAHAPLGIPPFNIQSRPTTPVGILSRGEVNSILSHDEYAGLRILSSTRFELINPVMSVYNFTPIVILEFSGSLIGIRSPFACQACHLRF